MISLHIFRNRGIALDDQVRAYLEDGAVVAIGVSGGKDSWVVAIALCRYLRSISYTGEIILIHSDLGIVEWSDSLPSCQRLADFLGLELAVVRRKAGDMMDRWNKRWSNNVSRYEKLECVKLIPPWSTAEMRFCTAELKRDVICQYLASRYPGRPILSVTGIRRDESPKRAKSKISSAQSKLSRKSGTRGIDWHPILDWTLDDVWSFLEENQAPLHEAYTVYGASRVSCSFCILAKKSDLAAASLCHDNARAYRAMVDLEIRSTFSFQDKQWLGDIAPHLLSDSQKLLFRSAVTNASRRREAESVIPSHLLYVKGWPLSIPTGTEADLLAEVRKKISDIVGLKPEFVTRRSIIGRYKELMSRKK